MGLPSKMASLPKGISIHARVCMDSPQTSSRSTRVERQCVLAAVTCVHNPRVLHGLNSGFVCWICATNADMRRGCMMHLLEVPFDRCVSEVWTSTDESTGSSLTTLPSTTTLRDEGKRPV
jgi:hypothetical protein